MVDIEFVAQFLQLVHAGKDPAIVSTETEKALVAARDAGLLSPDDGDLLINALRLYQALTQILRLALDDLFDPATAARGLLDRLAKAAELPDFATLDRHLRETQGLVRAAFERLIGKVSSNSDRLLRQE